MSSIKLRFLGAAGGIVTGSCHYIDTPYIKAVVDCGMFQGERKNEALNWRNFDFDPAKLDVVFLTHAHLDHVGRLPLLVKHGFKGKIIATDATRDLAYIVMQDATKLHMEAVERGRVTVNGQPVSMPLWDQSDVEAVMRRFQIYDYGEKVDLKKGVTFRMREAGHILGSVSFELWLQNAAGRTRKLVFSGDLGQTGARIIRDPDFIREADYVIVESTYGGRYHKDKSSTILEFLSILDDIARDNSVAVIPTFAVERTQEILYELNLLVEKNVVDPGLKFYLDSPMASKATMIFERYRKYYDQDALDLIRAGDDIFKFRGFEIIENVKQSKQLAYAKKAVIMAGSGMCTGGRVLHHLINFLPDSKNHLVFVGFQVPGTLGRRILDGAKKVRIYGKTVEVKAQVHSLGGFSAHADQGDLMYWLRNFGHYPREVFIVHGDNDNRIALKIKIENELQLSTNLPELGQEYELD